VKIRFATLFLFLAGCLFWLACSVQGQNSTITSNFHPGIPNPAAVPPVWFDSSVVSSQSVTDATGRPTQTHIICAANSGTWWLFWINNTTNSLQTSYSTDLIHWNPGTAFVLSNNLFSGVNFSVAYKNIAGVDIVHIVASYWIANNNRVYGHIRAVVTGTTITFGAESLPQGAATLNFSPSSYDGPTVSFGTDDRVYDFVSFWNDSGGAFGNFDTVPSSNFDLGSSWVAGWPGRSDISTVSDVIASHFGAPLNGGNMLSVQDDGGDCNPFCEGDITNLLWDTGNNTGWGGTANLFAGFASGTVTPNDWSAIQVDNLDYYLVVRLNATTLTWQKFNGVSWSVPGAAIPAQTSLSGSGPFLATDGTNLWLFIIDSDAPHTIRVNEFNGTTWGTWTAVTTDSNVRSHLSGYQTVVGNQITLLWTQFDGVNYNDIVGSYPVP
jgi:hypothetical protein